MTIGSLEITHELIFTILSVIQNCSINSIRLRFNLGKPRFGCQLFSIYLLKTLHENHRNENVRLASGWYAPYWQWRIQDFLQEGAPTPHEGREAPTYDFAKFYQKLHEIERIWAGGAHASLAPP